MSRARRRVGTPPRPRACASRLIYGRSSRLAILNINGDTTLGADKQRRQCACPTNGHVKQTNSEAITPTRCLHRCLGGRRGEKLHRETAFNMYNYHARMPLSLSLFVHLGVCLSVCNAVTFDGAPLRRLAAMTVRGKKSSEVKYKGLSD